MDSQLNIMLDPNLMKDLVDRAIPPGPITEESLVKGAALLACASGWALALFKNAESDEVLGIVKQMQAAVAVGFAGAVAANNGVRHPDTLIENNGTILKENHS